jgi:hypothetical protein
MQEAQLVVLAAGMGSRYGGLKQIEGLGPGGATLLEYSVYDALQAGFTEIVFIIRKAIEEDFKKHVLTRFKGRIPFQLVYQELQDVPNNFLVDNERVKPWGTAHALWCARDAISHPFAVINADDFYGREAFMALIEKLNTLNASTPMCMVGYNLAHTLTESGTVSRGVCSVNDGFLTHIEEHTGIARQGNKIVAKNGGGEATVLPENTIVSMNCWGFAPIFMESVQEVVTDFFDGLAAGKEVGSECYLPTIVRSSLAAGAQCRVISSDAQWCGVTYPADKVLVQERLLALTEAGIYPTVLI